MGGYRAMPVTPFEVATSSRIVFGSGRIEDAGAAVRAFGTRALFVTGSSPGRTQAVGDVLKRAGVDCVPYGISGEPEVEDVRRGVVKARQERCDVVIAAGGGSPIDGAKAIAALLTNDGDLFDYLEVIGQGRRLEKSPLPFFAVPTTAGTGAEVTRNAVIASPEHRVKASLRSPLLLSRIALVDPDLTANLPPPITANSGMDALTQLIEPYVSTRANPMTDAVCREGMPRVAGALRRVFEHGDDPEARANMSLSSLFSGIALANAGLGAVHGFAAAIGGQFPAPHGGVCAAMLPPATEINIRALRERTAASTALARYGEIARIVTGRPHAEAHDLVSWLRDLVQALQISPLSRYGLYAEHCTDIVEKASRASSMKANPIVLNGSELEEIFLRSL
jgi:alcohol dehydrogenase class IV